MWNRGVLMSVVFLGMCPALHAEEVVEDDWEKTVKSESAAAEEDFSKWKSTGKLPEGFRDHAVRGDRADLFQRQFSGDKLAESEIRPDLPIKSCQVTIRDTAPMESAVKEGDSYNTVWRRITQDRFEIWTPKSGKLYDRNGKQVAEAKVRRGDGWGREWYGAFLPDGRWVTTDINELDRELTAFSATGKALWSVKGAKLIPQETSESTPLIAWARADQQGKTWIVSVGSEWGRGFVKVTPDGKWTKIDDPWKECFPQQLRERGMYLDRFTRSDEGSILVNRTEAGHGMYVGWPSYRFLEKTVTIPNGHRFGVLPQSWTVFVESDAAGLAAGEEERRNERVWFFDAKGNYQRWIKGRTVGASLTSGGLWIRLLDDSCARVVQGYAVKSHVKFATGENQPLIPVELHDDIGLGLFLLGERLVLGTWEVSANPQ